MDKRLDLCVKLAEKSEHVSVGDVDAIDGAVICNLLRLGAKSVISYYKSYQDYDDDSLTKSLNDKVGSSVYIRGEIIFSFKRISDDKIRIIAEKAKK